MPYYDHDKNYPFAAFITNLGKYAMQEEQGHFTEHGYISLSGDEWVHERPAEPEKKPSIRERLEQGKKECAEKNKAQPHKEKTAPEL